MKRRVRPALMVLLLLGFVGFYAAGCFSPALPVITVGGEKRAYLLHVPPGLDTTQRYPLVLALHQFSDTPAGTETLSGFSELADSEHFIVAYPKGINRVWNAGQRGAPDDVAFIEALVDHLAENYPVDTRCVYACGLSAGGMMSQWLACRSEKFAAIAAIAGSLTTGATSGITGPRNVPVMLIHGVADPIVPYSGGETYAGPGMRPTFLSAEAAATFWAERNGCVAGETDEALPLLDPNDPTRVTKFTTTCTAPNEVVRYKIEGGGHTWPGRKNWYPAFIVGATSQQLDATTEMWQFFQRHAKP